MDGKVLTTIADTLGMKRLVPQASVEEQYIAGNHPLPYVPTEAIDEFKNLSPKAILNFTGLVNRSLLQDLTLIDYRHPDQALRRSTKEAWKQAGMPSKVNVIHRHAAVHGWSYSAIVPDLAGRTWQVVTLTPDQCYVDYQDFVNDPRPSIFACQLPGNPGLAAVWEGRQLYVLNLATKTLTAAGTSAQAFAGTEPVMRYDMGDLVVDRNHGNELRPSGEVRPLMKPQDRLNQAVMDLMLVQTFGAVALRWVAGLTELPDDVEEAKLQKIELAVDRLLVAKDPDTKFGSLIGTPLEPFIRNVDAAIRHFAIVGQIPPNRLLGELENIGADAILVARESQESKLTDYRERLGERHEKHARAIARAWGQPDPGDEGFFTWRSTELRTIAEIADAAVKVSSIGMNAEPLIRRSLRWRSEETDELLEGYQDARQSVSPDVAALVGAAGRQRGELTAIPDRTSQNPQ